MSGKWFDEIRDSNGNVREHYRQIYDCWQSIKKAERKRLHDKSARHLSGDYAVDPLPRVIIQSEYRMLQRGVEQRAQAILAFLHDYSSGGRRWKKIIPTDTLDAIIDRHHTTNVLDRLNPKTIAFPYGPDIIRSMSGRWCVLEDSAGYLGGMGDLQAGHEVMLRLVPGYGRVLHSPGESKPFNDPRDFFERLARHFQSKARKKNGVAALYLQAFEHEPDHETRRLAVIFESLGISVVAQESSQHRLEIVDSGIFLRSGRKKERIGYLVLRSGPEHMDRRSPSSILTIDASKIGPEFDSRILCVAKWLSNTTPLENTLLKNRALTNFSPGVQFLNDKAFGLFVDSLVEFYLKEVPVLESIPARLMAYRNRCDEWVLDRTCLRDIVRRRDHYVIKRVDEDGGSGVWIGHKQTQESLRRLLDKIRTEPEKYIIQKYEHLSVLENRIVDLRIHAHVDQDEIIVSNTPWGRANWLNNNGKVNIGSNGFTSPVVVMRK